MRIEITEKCKHANGSGIRTILYNSEVADVLNTLTDYINNFDSEKIISAGDDFEEECEWSEIIGIALIDTEHILAEEKENV